jgi:hypothetical protein
VTVRILERQVGTVTWYAASALFATPYAARQAWEQVERKVPKGSLGLYRHGPDLPDMQGRVVTVVTMDRSQLLRCVRLLRAGEDYPLDETTLHALVARRARVVLQYGADGSSGRVKWRRPGRGATLSPEGDMREPGGEG